MTSSPDHKQCARCGSCTVVCPVFRVSGRETQTARGRMLLLSLALADAPSAKFADLFASCLLCGACEQACSRGLPITAMVRKTRERFPFLYGRHGLHKLLVRKTLNHPGLLNGLVRAGVSLQRLSTLPADSGLRRKLGLLDPRDEQTGLDRPVSRAKVVPVRGEVVAYYPGCLAGHLQPSVAEATRQLVAQLTGQPLHVPPLLRCCGLAASAAGDGKDARQLARANIKAFESFAGPIVTSCASCSAHLLGYPDLFVDEPRWYGRAKAFSRRITEFSAFLLSRANDLLFIAPQPLAVHYHDPCHLRFHAEGSRNPRRLLDQVEKVTRVEAEDGPVCCGQGGLFHLGYPELADRIFTRCMARALAGKAEVVTTTCSGCLMQWQQRAGAAGTDISVRHLAVLLAESLAPGGE